VTRIAVCSPNLHCVLRLVAMRDEQAQTSHHGLVIELVTHETTITQQRNQVVRSLSKASVQKSMSTTTHGQQWAPPPTGVTRQLIFLSAQLYACGLDELGPLVAALALGRTINIHYYGDRFRAIARRTRGAATRSARGPRSQMSRPITLRHHLLA
jgi:hypothetical protein